MTNSHQSGNPKLRWGNNSIYARIPCFPHTVSHTQLCWCGNSNHYTAGNSVLDIGSIINDNRLFNVINDIWSSRPKMNTTESLLIANVSCEVTYTKKNRPGSIFSYKRGLNVAITEENLAQSSLYIFNILKTKLDLLRETNASKLLFRPISGVDIIAWVGDTKLGEMKFLDELTYDSKAFNPPSVVLSLMLSKTGSKRKAPTDGTLLIPPRDFEMSVTNESHPYLVANPIINASAKKAAEEEKQPPGSSRSIVGDSNKTTSTKTTTTKRKISKPLLTKKTPSHSKINNKDNAPKDSPAVVENPCQSEKSLQPEEKSCQSLSLPASTNVVTSTSTTSSVLSTSSFDKKRARFCDQAAAAAAAAAARSEDALASRTGSTPPNVIKIETQLQLPGAALVSPFKEEGGGKTTTIAKHIIDEASYENVSSSDSSASSSSEDEEEHNTPLNIQNSKKRSLGKNFTAQRSLGKNFTAQTVSISKTSQNDTDDKKLMPPPPKLPTQLKKNGGHEKKDGDQSIDFKKTE